MAIRAQDLDLRCGPYTFETVEGKRIKDPINMMFVDMAGDIVRVVDLIKALGYASDWGVGNQYFAEPDSEGARTVQDANQATQPLGVDGRDHIRLRLLEPGIDGHTTVVGAVHRERWPKVGWFRKTCDAVESFDAPRRELTKRLRAAGFIVEVVRLGNRNPLPQCDQSMPRSDGRVAVVREPG